MNEEFENNTDEVIKEDTVTIKQQLTTVTTFSKYLALTLFITLPFIGFWVGYTLAPEKIVEVEEFVEEKGVTKITNEKEQLIVPETVSLNLRKTFDEANVPVLALSVYAGGGCDEVSDLEISEDRKEGTMFVYIKGYSVTRNMEPVLCPDVVAEARAEIEVEEFLQNGGRQITFVMDDKESTYSISKNERGIYLEPMEFTNVISHEVGHNQPDVPISLELIVEEEDV